MQNGAISEPCLPSKLHRFPFTLWRPIMSLSAPAMTAPSAVQMESRVTRPERESNCSLDAGDACQLTGAITSTACTAGCVTWFAMSAAQKITGGAQLAGLLVPSLCVVMPATLSCVLCYGVWKSCKEASSRSTGGATSGARASTQGASSEPASNSLSRISPEQTYTSRHYGDGGDGGE